MDYNSDPHLTQDKVMTRPDGTVADELVRCRTDTSALGRYPPRWVLIWTTSPSEPRRNILLATLDSADLESLVHDLEPVSIDYREVLYHPGEPLSHVYFPVSGMVSIVAVSA